MELLPHQIEDAWFLAGEKFAGCFSDMGTGKTLTALEAARLVIEGPRGYGNALGSTLLIIAPPIALPMWKREAEAHLGWSDAQILKTGSTKIDRSASVHICSYDIATKRAEELAEFVSGGVVICDEAHVLKNPSAKRTKKILGKRGIVSTTEHAWMLTGTPVTRWNDDLFPFLCRADMAGMRKRCGKANLDRFRLRFCITQKRQFPGARFPTRMTVGNQNTDELNEWIYRGGLAVRRVLKEVWDAMPPLTTNRYQIPMKLSPELKEALGALKGMSVTQVQELLQSDDASLSTLRRLIGTAKAPAAAEEIGERLNAGLGPVLVGVWHTAVVDALTDQLTRGGVKVAAIDGRCSSIQKSRAEAQFNEGEVDVLIGQIASMGVSLNLQKGGNRIIVVEEDWSPAVMDQFYARLYRMGQEKHVHIDILSADNKIEDALSRIASTKRREQSRLNRQEEA